jgi:hypothetical protein
MNEKNHAYLRGALKYLGFGETLYPQLAEKLKEGGKEFLLGHSAAFNERNMDATLYFRKSDTSDLYFLNRWIGTVGQYDGAQSQSFYVNKGHGITLKEGFNLLEGRAVQKELADKNGQHYKAWLQLDGKEKDPAGNYKVNQFHEKYGFDLEKKLSELPIKQLGDPEQKAVLIKSLQKGNLQTVTFEKNGQSDQLFIAANPKFKAISTFDQAGNLIPAPVIEKRYGLGKAGPEVTVIGKAMTKEPTLSHSKETGAKQELKSDKQPKAAQAAKPATDAMPKKRTGKNKGMHL